MKIPRLLLTFVAIIIFSSCADKIVESVPSIDEKISNNVVRAKFSDIQNKVFDKSCALSGCHVTGVQKPGLSGNSYNNIVNVKSSTGMNYIEPGSPEKSYLYLKITGAPGISGNTMPLGASPLNSRVIDSISVWIKNGAQNN